MSEIKESIEDAIDKIKKKDTKKPQNRNEQEAEAAADYT
jgi:hypothetical protein